MKSTVCWILLYVFCVLRSSPSCGAEKGGVADTCFSRQVSLEFRGGHLFQTNDFLAGHNREGKVMNRYSALHLRYAFRFAPGSGYDRLYGGAYQGLGLAGYAFGNRQELGNPFVAYFFQGARIARVYSSLSLNYEWNFGLSWGWRPYDAERNPYNIMMGSRVNAYIGMNFFFDWVVASRWQVRAGLDLVHFSNGNTRLPNAGLNIVGVKLGVAYSFADLEKKRRGPEDRSCFLPFKRHVSYDVVLFGSWRRKIYEEYGEWHLSPKAYGVLGAGVGVMYNPGRRLSLGGAFDVVYDASANEFYAHDPSASDGFVKPPLTAKIALGLSARTEYVMPYFTVGIGLGANILHRGGELKAFYQMLYLKIALTRVVFLHVGYRLQEFSTPNYLMLGFGFRFNNKRAGIR